MRRHMLLAAMALPVVIGSRALADWARDDPHAAAERNTVWLCPRGDRLTTEPSNSDPLTVHTASTASPDKLTQACWDVSRRWKSILPGDHEVIVRAPYVLAGNLNRDELEKIYANTISPASAALQRLYFSRRPNQAITFLLFKDERSYRDAAWRLFAQNNVSIYGYYKPSSRTVVINQAAGEGTLVHELFHALADFDFPGIPIWLNEGMASLYEQCRVDLDDQGPRITPLLNWRLEILHEAMSAGNLDSIKRLAGSPHFRGPHEALKYAHARYFCMYLAERGLLDDYYRNFRENQHRDPHGIATLGQLSPSETVMDLDRGFQRWALGLQLAARPHE